MSDETASVASTARRNRNGCVKYAKVTCCRSSAGNRLLIQLLAIVLLHMMLQGLGTTEVLVGAEGTFIWVVFTSILIFLIGVFLPDVV